MFGITTICTRCGTVIPRWQRDLIWCPHCGQLLSTDFVSMGGFKQPLLGCEPVLSLGCEPVLGLGCVPMPMSKITKPTKPTCVAIELREITEKDDLWG